MVAGRSSCDNCGRQLSMFELAPILSWLMLRGRCRTCDVRIDPVQPLAEILAIITVLWAATETQGLILIASSIMGWLLLTLGMIDWRHQLLPDKLTAALGFSGFVVSLSLDHTDFPDHLIGAALGFLTFWAIARLYRHWRGREGLGLGDAKLLGAIGLWLGWQPLPTVILLASLFGLVAALVALVAGKSPTLTTRLPFGTFLATAAWIVWLYGPLTLS